MNRTTLDRLLATSGAVIALVLLLGGGLLTWAHVYVHGEVTSQLKSEKIYFPDKGSAALASNKIGPYLDKYAGQQLETGAQAEAWADHYIAVHLQEIGGGKTYAQLSTGLQADPTNTKLAAQVQTVFQGQTLRGLLLNAYAFDTMATIALVAAIVAFIGALLLGLLSILGFRHARHLATFRATS